MKKLILSSALVAFAVTAALADDAGAKANAEPSCCSAKAKTTQKASVQTSASCPMAQTACCSKEKQTAAKKTMVKQALLSPKAAASL